MIPQRLSTLGHPQRLALFRLLMRRYPDRVPATELARALGLKANTLSTYVNALMQSGLISQERVGTSLRYAIKMDAARATIDYLLDDCCRGRPEICAPVTPPSGGKTDQRLNVLFICTGNSARSIFAESILRRRGGDRFAVYSAGTQPRSALNPHALNVLENQGHDTTRLRAKNLTEFQAGAAPDFDFVFTVCDQAANGDCPVWPGRPIAAHWGLPDPVQAQGADQNRLARYEQTYDALDRTITEFTALPFSEMAPLSLQAAVDALGQNMLKGHIQ